MNLEMLLRSVTVQTPAEVEILTEPRMWAYSSAGVPNLYRGRVRKRSHWQCRLCAHYATEVNVRRIQEGKPADFVAERRLWGKPIPATPLMEHKGQLYLRCLVDQVLEERYELDGKPVPDSQVAPWLPGDSASNRQGLDDEVVLRLVKLENVVQVHLN